MLAVGLITALAAPSFAAESMMAAGKPMSMTMKPGETMAVMPNGMTMMMPPMKADTAAMKADMDMMMKAAKPMDKCMIMMMGKDGKMYMMDDMKMADGKMACESMSMMKK